MTSLSTRSGGPVGKLLMDQRAGTVKKLSLELGGNAPFIVFDDSDIEMAGKTAPMGIPCPLTWQRSADFPHGIFPQVRTIRSLTEAKSLRVLGRKA
jgi:hypothetical protein